jgi:nucleoid DNA-binding protein
MEKLINKIEDHPKGLAVQAFKDAVTHTKNTCGMPHNVIDSIIRIFARELADALAHNKIVEIPHLGTFFYAHKTRHRQLLHFKVTKEYKTTKIRGGTDENNFIRAIEESSSRNSRRNERDI